MRHGAHLGRRQERVEAQNFRLHTRSFTPRPAYIPHRTSHIAPHTSPHLTPRTSQITPNASHWTLTTTRGRVLIETYDGARVRAPLGELARFRAIVCDESHNLKTPEVPRTLTQHR